VSGVTPTRAAVLDLKDEQRAMHEGHVFLDEKCLLLAGEMLRELARHAELERTLRAAHDAAMGALQAALARHGLQGLQVQPAAGQEGARLQAEQRSLMGVRLQQARWVGADEPAAPAVHPSPEAQACREAFAALLAAAPPLAAVTGNLERLSQEYRRSVRRARALQDVLLPELAREIYGIETRLEELEQEDAVTMRRRA
jgi:V/A-type H+/Na+-transporting ATPase subunit D